MWALGFCTCPIAEAESQVEGDHPGHGPGGRLHGQGAFVAVQQRHQRGHVRQPAPGASAESHEKQHGVIFQSST